MKKKAEINEIETLVSEALNSDKPNKNVLDAAKQLMYADKVKEKKDYKIRIRKRWRLVGVYCCALILVVLCSLPLILKQPGPNIEDNEFLTENLISINEYNKRNNAQISSLNFDITSSTLYSEYSNGKKKDIYIEETYSANGEKIELYIILNETEKNIIAVKNYTAFTNQESLNGISIAYKIVDDRCFATFDNQGYSYMLSCEANVATMLSYIAVLSHP